MTATTTAQPKAFIDSPLDGRNVCRAILSAITRKDVPAARECVEKCMPMFECDMMPSEEDFIWLLRHYNVRVLHLWQSSPSSPAPMTAEQERMVQEQAVRETAARLRYRRQFGSAQQHA